MNGIRTFFKVLANVLFTNTVALATVGLTSPIAANQSQNFRAWIPFTLGATGGFKIQITTPAAPTKYAVAINIYDTVGGTLLYDAIVATAPFGNALAAAGTYWAEVTGYVKNGATAGNIDILIAQNSSTGNALTVLEGGYMDVIKS